MDDLPKLPVKIIKKLKTLSLTYKDSTGTFDIEDGAVDLIEIDQWISDTLFDISKPELEKNELRKRLMGK